MEVKRLVITTSGLPSEFLGEYYLRFAVWVSVLVRQHLLHFSGLFFLRLFFQLFQIFEAKQTFNQAKFRLKRNFG